jgi:uncharacterized protein (TIGR02246 family)
MPQRDPRRRIVGYTVPRGGRHGARLAARMPVRSLADRQLVAYNANDLDAFCACYHPDVVVYGADGAVSLRGMDAFRARYGALFAEHTAQAEVDARVVLPPHLVEREHWRRVARADGSRAEGSVLVRYTERDGLIAVVQFFAAAPRS